MQAFPKVLGPDGGLGTGAGARERVTGIRNTFIHSLTISAPASSRSEQPGPPLPDYDLLRKPPWAAALHYPTTGAINTVQSRLKTCKPTSTTSPNASNTSAKDRTPETASSRHRPVAYGGNSFRRIG